MCSYFYSDIDIEECKEIITSYAKKTMFERKVIQVVHRNDYFGVECLPLNIRHIPLRYKLKMAKYENKTMIEVKEVHLKWFIIYTILKEFFSILILITILVALINKINLSILGITFIWIGITYWSIKSTLILKSLKKNMNAELARFLKEKLDAKEAENEKEIKEN